MDLVVCVALGCDMFDCVFPTRTAVGFFFLSHLQKSLLNSDSGQQICYVSLTVVVVFPSEVWLCLGALGISAGETETVCQRFSTHRSRLSVSNLQEVNID